MILKQSAPPHSCDYRSSVVLHKHMLNVNVSYSVRNKGEGGTWRGYQVKGHVLIFSFKESRLQLQTHTHSHTRTHTPSICLQSERAQQGCCRRGFFCADTFRLLRLSWNCPAIICEADRIFLSAASVIEIFHLFPNISSLFTWCLDKFS